MRFFRNAASVLATSVAMVPIGLVTSIVLSRYLGTADFGLYAVAMGLAFVVGMLAQLGWQSAAIYRIRRAGRDPGLVLFTGALVMLGVSAVAIAACLAARGLIEERLLPGADPSVLYLALASIPFHLLFNVFQAVARAVDRFDLANLANLARAGGLLCAAVGVLIVAGGGLEQALVAILIVHGLATVILGIVVARETGVQWRVDREEIVESARFGSRSYAHYMTGELHERLDLFMIAYLLADPAQAGLYAIAVRLIGALKLVPDALAASLFTVAAGMSEREAGRLTSFVSRHSLLWTVAAVVALAAVAPLAVRLLFGEQYSGAIPPLQVLLLAMAMLTVARVLSRYFVAVGRQRANIVTQILAVLLNLTLNLLWIPRYGIIGAAWASLASYGLQALLIVVWFGRDSGRGIRDALLVQRGDFAEYRQRLTPLLERLRSS